MADETQRKIAQQRRTITVLACFLIVSGVLIIFFLKRVPPPMRILVGLTDFFAGLILLVLVRQKFGKEPRL